MGSGGGGWGIVVGGCSRSGVGGGVVAGCGCGRRGGRGCDNFTFYFCMSVSTVHNL